MFNAEYQTADDLVNEKIIAERFCTKYKLQYVKIPMKYQIDYVLTGLKTNSCLGVMECKVRHYNLSELPDVILSLKKYEALMWWGKNFLTQAQKNLACMFCCKFDDGFYGYRWQPDHNFTIEVGGRTKQTRTSDDVEPVVRIPVKYFKEF